MKELLKKVQYFESMISKFAESKSDEANDAFANRHGYDLRYSKNNDYLKYIGYNITENVITLKYEEITPHDCPYYISIESTIKKLDEWYKGLRVEKLERINK